MRLCECTSERDRTFDSSAGTAQCLQGQAYVRKGVRDGRDRAADCDVLAERKGVLETVVVSGEA